MKYSVVIPTYNHCEDLLKPCVESLLKYSRISDVELIISANGCKDTTFEYLGSLREKFNYLGLKDNLKIVWSAEALGFSRATNAGIEIATTDLIVLLNNDTLLLEQPKNVWLMLLEQPFLDHPNCGITCIIKGPSAPAGRDFAVFFCVMVHKKVFNKIGLLNTDYGVGGGEDTEFCIEAENAGFEVRQCIEKTWSEEANLFVGNFPIYHKGEGTMHDPKLVPDWSDIFLANSIRLSKKYNPDWYKALLAKNPEHIPIQDLSWLEEQDQLIYSEVITGNHYRVNEKTMKDRNVIDIGANVGMFSLLASSLGAKKVVGVEPSVRSHHKFLENIKRSGFTNIVPMKKIVTEKSGGKANLGIDDVNPGCSSPFYTKYDTWENDIPTITLADILKQFKGDNIYLKIDCEGGEYDILLNATKKDMDRIDEIGIEIHEDMHPTYKGRKLIEDKLTSFGFINEHTDQMFGWNVDAEGNKKDWTPLSYLNQHWIRAPHVGENLDWLKEQDPKIYSEVFTNNHYRFSPEKLKGRNVIDIGANLGMVSLYASYCGAKKVVAVEPVKEIYDKFVSNIKRAGYKNIVALKNVVLDKAGKKVKVSINNEPENTGANSIYNVVDQYEGNIISITLSDILKQFKGDNIFLKLDCEGAEFDIIPTATKKDLDRINEIEMEIHTDLHPKYKDDTVLAEKLTACGFTKLEDDQVFIWDTDAQGNRINWKPLPYKHQHWKR